MAETAPEKTAIYVALVQELLKADHYATISDLAEAVKCRAARLRLRYDGAVVQRAIAQVEHRHPIVGPPDPPASRPIAPERRDLPRAEAAALLADIRAKVMP